MYSKTVNNLIAHLKKLPSVGQRTAERFVFHWLKAGKKEVGELRGALADLLQNVKSCEVCWDFGETSPCPICRDPRRDRSLLCVVADSQDLAIIEKTGEYHGLYHVLRGQLNFEDDEATLKKIKNAELIKRLKNPAGKIKEVVLALNPDLPGETTMLYLKSEIARANPKIKITRLSRGLPLGSDLQYADEITLASAMSNRREM